VTDGVVSFIAQFPPIDIQATASTPRTLSSFRKRKQVEIRA
jgi:hypothetical protein